MIVGSFLNVIIYRLPRGESIVLPPSHCPYCQHRLGIFDLFPVLSYIGLKGRCRYCRSPISWRYPAVELLTGILTGIWFSVYGLNIAAIPYLLLTYVCIAIAFIDLDHQIIPDRLTLPMMILGLLVRLYQGNLFEALIGGFVGGGILMAIILVYPKGMGMGDVKFLAMAGIWLGWEKAVVTLFLGSLIGTVLLVPFMGLKKIDRRTPVPFGPFLALGVLFILYGGKYFVQILPWGGL
ncbi:prepilin peptidase [Hydrogenispora ethanolica]|nr:prepilin peptidase [Hydrogenispora ethanolica]